MNDLNMMMRNTTTHADNKDPAHIGEIAAQQPLSGVVVVTPTRINGVSSNRFYYTDSEKQSA